MLLQIAEPGQSSRPHEHRLAIGIDLGTTHSLVASVKSGEPVVLPDEQGRLLLPSIVNYQPNGDIQVGWDVPTTSQKQIRSIKRLMGLSPQDFPILAQQPNQVSDQKNTLSVVTDQGLKTPVEVSAEILKVLRIRAEKSLGGNLLGAVITVPAYFDDAQRQATKDAAQLAGIHVLRLINEPTAAAIAYGLENKTEGTFLVYDLGGGTFDVSILRLSTGVFEVLATKGNTHLGGDDFDRALLLSVVPPDQFTQWPETEQKKALWYARQIKEKLSQDTQALFDLTIKNQHFSSMVKSTDFAHLTASLIKQTIECVEQALDDAQLTIQHIDDIILVGGATRMPHLKNEVNRYFQKSALDHMNPDTVVALGAAIQADKLAGNQQAQDDWLLLDITPLSLGIETMGGLTETIIPRQSTLPTARAQDFTTYQDGQTQMSIHVVQGEQPLVSACRSLAKFTLKDIPPMAAGAARIRVQFSVDADGLLSVSAQEQTTGKQSSVVVKPSHGLDDETLTRLLEARFANDPDMLAKREFRANCVEAIRAIAAISSAVEVDRAVLVDPQHGGSLAELEQVSQACEQLVSFLASPQTKMVLDGNLPDWLTSILENSRQVWMWKNQSDSLDLSTTESLTSLSLELDQKTQHLLRVSEPFASRRMNLSIQTVLKGKSIDQTF
jgi:molecular chaperone HscA